MAANTPGVINASVGFDEATLQPTYELKVGVPGASAGINIAQRLGLNPAIIEAPARDSARKRRTSATSSTGCMPISATSNPNAFSLKTREQELEREKSASRRGRQQRTAGQNPRDGEETREPSSRLRISAREAVNAVQDRAAAQKFSKDAERRIAKMRREFREQFDSTVVAHSTGADPETQMLSPDW